MDPNWVAAGCAAVSVPLSLAAALYTRHQILQSIPVPHVALQKGGKITASLKGDQSGKWEIQHIKMLKPKKAQFFRPVWSRDDNGRVTTFDRFDALGKKIGGHEPDVVLSVNPALFPSIEVLVTWGLITSPRMTRQRMKITLATS